MANMTRGEMQDLVSKFATENPRYREALIADPKGTLERQFGSSLGAVEVKAVVERADQARRDHGLARRHHRRRR